jgi:hypothetical protein
MSDTVMIAPLLIMGLCGMPSLFSTSSLKLRPDGSLRGGGRAYV